MVDWRVVRGISRLHILNRTSILLIVVVPILASLWPVVQHSLAWYDGSLATIESRLNSVVASVRSLPAEGAISVAARRDLLELRKRLSMLRLRSEARFPSSLASLFFASLCVLFGQAAFQLGCPDTVKDVRIDEFTRDRKREYAEAPSSTAVDNAIRHLSDLGKHDNLVREHLEAEARAREEAAELLQRVADAELNFEHLEQQKAGEGRLRDAAEDARLRRDEYRRFLERDRGDRGPDFRRRMALVERSARLQYLNEAQGARVAMLICILLYLGGLSLLGAVLVHQSATIARVAGWL